VIEATEEANVNALCMADDMTGQRWKLRVRSSVARAAVLAAILPACAGPTQEQPAASTVGSQLVTPPAAVQRRYAGRAITGEYNVCVDTDGAVTRVDVLQPIPGADDDIMAQVRGLRFRKQASPSCAKLRLTFAVPPLDATQYRELPRDESAAALSLAIETAAPALSPAWRERYAGQHPRGGYEVFVEPDGTVGGVAVLKSIPGCDDYVRDKLFGGTYPNDGHERVRFRQTVELIFPETPAAPTTEAIGPATHEPKYKAVPLHVLDTAAIERPMPHLPDLVKIKNFGRTLVGTYLVSVDLDGHVARVDIVTSIPGGDDAIITTLKRWKFRPQPLPVRTIMRFVFQVGGR
jgi:hypothetical protein